MTNIRFDHFITYTNAANIDDYLKEYAAQGFAPGDQTVRHDPGLRNGFIWFGPEYIEFCWVEDETLFAKGDMEEQLLRKEPRPFGIGMVADDVQTVHNDWTARGYSVPEVFSKSPRDTAPGAPPRWSFQGIPDELLLGTSCFVLAYHSRPKDEVRQIKIPPNTIYAVSGVTFVTQEAEKQVVRWRDLLAPDEQVRQSSIGFDVRIGPHLPKWMMPDTYQDVYNIRWIPSHHSFGDLALLNLLASDLRAVKTMMERSGRRTRSIGIEGEQQLLIEPDTRGGFTFLVKQQSPDIWIQERITQTSEKLELV